LTSERFYSQDAELAKKGRGYECSQYCLRSVDRAVHDPADSEDAQAETTRHRVRTAKDVPIMRIDHVSIKGKLYGMWQALYGRRVFDFKEMNRRFAHVSPELLG
jgi:hypothetical protein